MRIFSARGGRSWGRSAGGSAAESARNTDVPAARSADEIPAADQQFANGSSAGEFTRETAAAPPPTDRPARGDELAETLYRRYSVPLLSFCLKHTGGDRQWAEDVVQETLVRAWRNADRIDPSDEARSLMPWLATVARRIVIDDRRARSARPQEVNPEPLEYVPADDQVEPLLRSMVVADALQSLSQAHREVLVETVLRDRSVNQAAEALGIPVGTVKSRVYYAVRALKLALEERGVNA
ncbi:sigma-70 family RNA polymerase sigma factor [Yinghuangia sp. YIM S09857]|uniref:sigma-70 family RNA polymerase sigma factor n=1 Tax=Yinghuangia sp. YIM S09857 TaxID=3436929 RepID=UPI003F52AD91